MLASPLTYGFNIVALNQIQLTLQCDDGGASPFSPNLSTFPVCIPMSDTVFGLVTSIFTVGGLIGSLFAGAAMNNYGRKGALKLNSTFIGLGSALMMVAWSPMSLTVGRYCFK